MPEKNGYVHSDYLELIEKAEQRNGYGAAYDVYECVHADSSVDEDDNEPV